MESLKPCPFCGRNTVKIIPYIYNNRKVGYLLSHWYENKSDCPIAVPDEDSPIGSTYFVTKEEAIVNWNQRFG